MNGIVCQLFPIYHIKGTGSHGWEDAMDYKRIIISTLDCLNAGKGYVGYDFVVYGLTLMLDDENCAAYITKSLYIDIAKHYNTTWNCVEKNIRTVVHSIWDSADPEMLRLIFKSADREKRPTNKEFFRYMYEYIVNINGETFPYSREIKVICPISHKPCSSLAAFYMKLSSAEKKEQE